MRTINTPGNLGNDYFALDLRYENPDGSVLPSGQYWNGNIAEMRWQTKDNTPKGFGFTYDSGGRLREAASGDGPTYAANPGYFNSTYTYDRNGNLSTLTRKSNNTLIDNLAYAYESSGRSNRLTAVSDQVANTGVFDGFKKYTSGLLYQYDRNGSMKYDPSKGVTVAYNRLNLPEKATFSANDYVAYAYDATGRKLVKRASGASSTGALRTDYSRNYLYEDNKLPVRHSFFGRYVNWHTYSFLSVEKFIL